MNVLTLIYNPHKCVIADMVKISAILAFWCQQFVLEGKFELLYPA